MRNNQYYGPYGIPNSQFEMEPNYPGYMNEMMPKKFRVTVRNQLKGKVTAVKEGGVNAQVTIDIGCGNVIMSTITIEALRRLGIKVGSSVTTRIKESHITIGAGTMPETVGVINRLNGKVTAIKVGDINSEVTVDIGCGDVLTALPASASIQQLGIRVGSSVTVFIRASDVIISM